MPEYEYTDTEVRVFSDLSHGPDVRVIRDGKAVEVAPEDAGSTVVLHPGDVLDTDEPLPFFHAFLKGSVHPGPVEDPEPAVPAGDTPPAPEPVPDTAPARRRKAAGDEPPAGDTPTT